MEISSLPNFLSPTPTTFDDFSHFYSPSPSLYPALDLELELEPNSTKRRKTEAEAGGVADSEATIKIKDILSSFLMFEDEVQKEQNNIGLPQWLAQPQTNEPENDQHFSSVKTETRLSPEVKRQAKRPRNSPATEEEKESNAGAAAPTHQRRLWVKDRSKDWWEKCNHPDFPEEEFKKAFRMSKSTFDMICEELDPIVTKKDTMLRTAIPVRQRVAVCIWRLATGEPLRLVSKRFGLGISTCHKLVLEVCAAIKQALMPKFLQWPDQAKVNEIKAQFESSTGIPNVGGSMYTTHIPIIAPKISVANYYNKRHTERNQKTSYSITVQGVVDHNGVFTDVCIGWPGSMQDDQILEKSALSQRANRGLLNNMWIVGSSGFPLMDWVLVPYTQPNLWTQHAFNEKILEIQNIAKRAFSRMKGRWGCLQKRTEVKLQELPVVLGACCVLHNICEMMDKQVDPEIEAFEVFDDEVVPENCIRSAAAETARDHIAHNLLHHGLAGTSFL